MARATASKSPTPCEREWKQQAHIHAPRSTHPELHSAEPRYHHVTFARLRDITSNLLLRGQLLPPLQTHLESSLYLHTPSSGERPAYGLRSPWCPPDPSNGRPSLPPPPKHHVPIAQQHPALLRRRHRHKCLGRRRCRGLARPQCI